MGERDRLTPSDGSVAGDVEPTPIFDTLLRAVEATLAEQPNDSTAPEKAPI
jgi:hypothetical protein